MGLFGGKDDTKQKIEELKAKMQGGQAPQGMPPQGPPQEQGGWQPPQQPWQGQQQQYQPPQQSWQPPQQPSVPQRQEISMGPEFEELSTGIILDLGDGMSLNLPVKSHMRLDEFLRLADRVRELKKIEHQNNY